MTMQCRASVSLVERYGEPLIRMMLELLLEHYRRRIGLLVDGITIVGDGVTTPLRVIGSHCDGGTF